MLLCLSLTDWLQQALLAYHVVHMFLDGVSSFHEVSPWALPPQFVRPTAAHSATKGDVGLGWKIGFPSCVSFSRESVSFTTHTGNFALTPVLGGVSPPAVLQDTSWVPFESTQPCLNYSTSQHFCHQCLGSSSLFFQYLSGFCLPEQTQLKHCSL